MSQQFVASCFEIRSRSIRKPRFRSKHNLPRRWTNLPRPLVYFHARADSRNGKTRKKGIQICSFHVRFSKILTTIVLITISKCRSVAVTRSYVLSRGVHNEYGADTNGYGRSVNGALHLQRNSVVDDRCSNGPL